MLSEIVIHTDGSCLHNPGRGGWAVVISDGAGRRELSGGARLTTNNRMEIRAAIEALRATPANAESLVTVTSDSQLLVNSIEKGWASKWRANRWMRNKNERAENPDLWEALLAEIEKRRVRFVWTRAHVGTLENERCDELAKSAAEYAVDVDAYYEQQRTGGNHLPSSAAGTTQEHTAATTLPVSAPSSRTESDLSLPLKRGASASRSASHDRATDQAGGFTVNMLLHDEIEIVHPRRGKIIIPLQHLPGLLAEIQSIVRSGR